MKKQITALFMTLAVLVSQFLVLNTLSAQQFKVKLTATEDTICSGDSSTLALTISNGVGPFTYKWSDNISTTKASVKVKPTITTIYKVLVFDTAGVNNSMDSSNVVLFVKTNSTPLFTVSDTCMGSPVIFKNKSTITPIPCSADLFFSEYVEGSGNNKAIEIHNSTGKAVNLHGYTLNLYSNGSSSWSQSKTFSIANLPLNNIIANGGTFVIAHGKANASILSVAQDTNSFLINYNGNDAMSLINPDGKIIDIFGRIGTPFPIPQWINNGVQTQNVTLRRKSAITNGVVMNPDSTLDPTLSFDPSLEWIQFAQNDISDLGNHSSNCENDTIKINVYDWNYGDGNTSDTTVTHSYLYTQPGKYNPKLTLTASNGCISTYSDSVSNDPQPFARITAKGDTTFCLGGSVVLKADPSFGNILWFKTNIDDTTAKNIDSIIVSEPGSYWFDVVNNCGSKTSRTIQVKVFTPIKPTITGNSFFCLSNAGTLIPDSSIFSCSTAGIDSFKWFVNAVFDKKGNPYIYNPTSSSDGALISLETIDSSGCFEKSSTIIVDISKMPLLTISPILDSICHGDTVILKGASDFSRFKWYVNNSLKADTTDSLFNYLNAKNGDLIKLVGIDGKGCKDSVNTIISNVADSVKAGSLEKFCKNTEIAWLLSTGSPVGGYWMTGDLIKIEIDSSGKINPSNLDTGYYDVKYIKGKCFDTKKFRVNKTTAPPDVSPQCIENGVFQLNDNSLLPSPKGGKWSGPGVINVDSGKIDPDVAVLGGLGSKNYVYTKDGCPDTMKVNYSKKFPATIITAPSDSITLNSIFFNWSLISGVTTGFNISINNGLYKTPNKSNLSHVYNDTLPITIVKVAAINNPGCGVDTAILNQTIIVKKCIPFSVDMFLFNSDSAFCVGKTISIKTKIKGGKGPFQFTPYNVSLMDAENPVKLNPADSTYLFKPLTPSYTKKIPDSTFNYKLIVKDFGQKNYSKLPGCKTISDSLSVKVYQNPKAVIWADTSRLVKEGIIQFSSDSSSKDVVKWVWDFGGGKKDSILRNPPQQYGEDGGAISINLMVKNNNGCSHTDDLVRVKTKTGFIYLNLDSIIKYILEKELGIYFPGIFSPNGDARNDEFRALPYPNNELSEMQMEIYNRLGQKIFSTSNINSGWNGKKDNGDDLDVGTYIYKIAGKDKNGKAIQVMTGTVVLVK